MALHQILNSAGDNKSLSILSFHPGHWDNKPNIWDDRPNHPGPGTILRLWVLPEVARGNDYQSIVGHQTRNVFARLFRTPLLAPIGACWAHSFIGPYWAHSFVGPCSANFNKYSDTSHNV